MRIPMSTLASRAGISGALVLLTLFAAFSQTVRTSPRVAGDMAEAPPVVQAPAGAAVVTVPWNGSEAQPHQVYSGGSLVLQGVATDLTTGAALSVCSSTWDFGDASPTASGGTNGYALEATHTYSGSVGQPFTATLTVTLNPCATGAVLSDTFKVVIAPNNLETKVNMARDKGLWNLHKRINRTTSDGLPSGYWINGGSAGNFLMATTAGVVQAFEVNGHRESGEKNKSPYVDDVARGLRYILSQQHGILTRVNIGAQATPTGYAATAPWPVAVGASNNPDVNGNGYGLYINFSGHASYLGGQLMDALVASGTPDKTAETGQLTNVRGRKYRDILQDMLDGYSWGMNDSVGGWHYSYNSGDNDTSASHWWAIGTLASNVWGLDAPDWVKNIQWNVGVTRMQAPPGLNSNGCYFGYTNNYNNWWGDNQMNVTAAGLIMLNADRVPQTHERYTCAMKWLDTYFNNQLGNYYTMYQLAKAMRTAIDSTGASAPITLLNGTRDWYAAYANNLVTNQQASGAFAPTAGSIGSYIQGDMASSWAILILSPSLFETPPTAVCSVDATTVCQAGATGGCNTTGTNPYATVNFDGSQSLPGDNPIATYAWNFQDGGATVDASTVTTSTQYAAVGTYNVQLTVGDTKGNTSSVTCPVSVTSSALPPIADAGGPYTVCVGTNLPLTLDATGSTGRGTNIVSYEWDFKGAINFAVVDATGVTSDQSAYFNSLDIGTYDVGVRITDDELAPNTNTEIAYSTVTVRDCAPPVITVPANISVVTPNASTPVSFAVSATDNVDAVVPVTCTSAPTAGLSSGSNFPVGTTTLTCTARDAAGNNADPKSFTITVSNNRAPLAVADTASTFSGTPVTVTVLTNDSDSDGDTLAVTGTSGGPANGSAVVNGDGTITYTPNLGFAGTDTFTYAISDGKGGTASAAVTITVTKRNATVTAGGGTKVYGAADPTFTPSSVGFLPADSITATQTARDAGETVGSYATHATAAGATLANYSVTYTDGTLTVTPATPAAATTGGTFTYDGQVHGSACTITGVGTDVLTGVVSYDPGPGVPTTPGTYAVSCTYAATDNYEAASASATITIDKAVATVTAGGGTKVYGTADPTFTPSSTGFLPADGITVTQTARDAGETVGSYATHATATGTALDNYAVTFTNGSLSITPAALMVTANSYTRSYLAADPLLTGTLTGVVAGDGITATYSSAGTGSQVPGVYPTVPTLVDPNSTLGNYAVTSVNGTLTITNTAPVCTAASASPASIWPPNHTWVPVTINGVTDVDGGPLGITIVSIFQDEPVDTDSDGHTGPDGKGVGTDTAWVRAERMGKSWKEPKSGKGSVKSPSSGKSGKSSSSSKSDKGGGNGRVYHITFTATDSLGLTCTGTVLVGVPHDQSGPAAVDDGALYDSTVAPPKSVKSAKSAKAPSAKAAKSSKAPAPKGKGKK